MADCGTDSGYNAHRGRDEDACDPCKAAHAERVRAYNHARNRALSRLAGEYRGRYAALLAEERAREAS